MSGSSRTFLLSPKWIAFHVLAFGSIAIMIWLAFWQLRRLDERQAFNATVTERIDEPPVAFDELLPLARTDPGAVEWRQVTVTGEYLSDQITWFNRSQDGLAGDNVLTALIDGDTTVLVNRGFILLDDDRIGAASSAWAPIERHGDDLLGEASLLDRRGGALVRQG